MNDRAKLGSFDLVLKLRFLPVTVKDCHKENTCYFYTSTSVPNVFVNWRFCVSSAEPNFAKGGGGGGGGGGNNEEIGG